jgi:hypothetical protein
MKLFLLYSIISAVLSAPILDDYEYNLDLLNNQDTIKDNTDIYDDHDYGTDSEFLDYDSDESDEYSDLILGSPVYYNLIPCGSNSLLSISSLEMIPDPPKTGQNLTLIASGFLRGSIVEGATLRVSVKLGFVTLYDHTDKVCDLTRASGLNCPIGRGEQSIVAGFPIPSMAPVIFFLFIIRRKSINFQ